MTVCLCQDVQKRARRKNIPRTFLAICLQYPTRSSFRASIPGPGRSLFCARALKIQAKFCSIDFRIWMNSQATPRLAAMPVFQALVLECSVVSRTDSPTTKLPVSKRTFCLQSQVFFIQSKKSNIFFSLPEQNAVTSINRPSEAPPAKLKNKIASWTFRGT